MPHRFYAVAAGRKVGVFTSWQEVEPLVKGFAGARYKGFATHADASSFAGGSSLPSTQLQMPPADKAPTRGRRLEPIVAARVEPVRSVLDLIPPEADMPTTVDVDGACRSNGKAAALAGYGAFFGSGDPRNIAEPLPRDEPQTNNRGELRACIAVLEHFEAADGDGPPPAVALRSDSTYCINGAQSWSRGWIRNGWVTKSGTPVENQDLWRRLLAAIRARELRRGHYFDTAAADVRQSLGGREAYVGRSVQWVKVKGHSGDAGNDGADTLAVRGALKDVSV